MAISPRDYVSFGNETFTFSSLFDRNIAVVYGNAEHVSSSLTAGGLTTDEE